MDSFVYLIVVFVIVVLGFLGILLSLRKDVRFKRFLKKHPDAIWVWYNGPSDSKINFESFEVGTGISFELSLNKRGIIVLPGPICVRISYSKPNSQGTAFTQTLQFTAVFGKEHILEVDDDFQVMRVIKK